MADLSPNEQIRIASLFAAIQIAQGQDTEAGLRTVTVIAEQCEQYIRTGERFRYWY